MFTFFISLAVLSILVLSAIVLSSDSREVVPVGYNTKSSPLTARQVISQHKEAILVESFHDIFGN